MSVKLKVILFALLTEFQYDVVVEPPSKGYFLCRAVALFSGELCCTIAL